MSEANWQLEGIFSSAGADDVIWREYSGYAESEIRDTLIYTF